MIHRILKKSLIHRNLFAFEFFTKNIHEATNIEQPSRNGWSSHPYPNIVLSRIHLFSLKIKKLICFLKQQKLKIEWSTLFELCTSNCQKNDLPITTIPDFQKHQMLLLKFKIHTYFLCIGKSKTILSNKYICGRPVKSAVQN